MDPMGEEDQPQERHPAPSHGGHQVSRFLHQTQQDGQETSMLLHPTHSSPHALPNTPPHSLITLPRPIPLT